MIFKDRKRYKPLWFILLFESSLDSEKWMAERDEERV